MTNGNEQRDETILIVEDDTALREGLAMNLRLRGYTVLTASDGDEGMRKAFDAGPDLLILDIRLPGFSGLDILDELREQEESMPVLILSARGSVADRIDGLRLGADDYLGKPFDLNELFARIDALLRRSRTNRSNQPNMEFGSVLINLGSRKVFVDGQEIELSAKEFDVLSLLARSPGRTFSRETILDRVWGWGFEGTPRTVDNFIMALRRKLEDNPTEPRHIRTVRQVGYRLDP